jgi:hypothetical protein
LHDYGKTDIFEIRAKIHWHCFTDCPTFVTVFVTQSINGTVLLSVLHYRLALIFLLKIQKYFGKKIIFTNPHYILQDCSKQEIFKTKINYIRLGIVLYS